jgi:CO/xanthine dehydrogenase Mo-binding subunit
VGRPIARAGGSDKVWGSSTFPADRPGPSGVLHAATVRASLASARLLEIDTAPALAVPGVVRVLTSADVPGINRFGLAEADQPVLADGWIRGASDVAALVIATDEVAARAGARATRLVLEPLPGVYDVERALDPDAPVVRPDRPGGDAHPNLFASRSLIRGDVDAEMSRAHVIVEGTYRTGHVEHAFLAPEAGLAVPETDGSLVLHVATQWPESDLRQAAAVLGEGVENFAIVQDTIGGAFGGREDVSLQILLLLAARLCEAPVRMVWDRVESIRGHGKRHPFVIRHRTGADAEGRLVAGSLDLLIDVGCYASTSRQLLDNALVHAFGPYDFASVRAAAQAVFTSNPYSCAFRGFGVNQVTFAIEQQLNRVAAELGLDPARVRRLNLPTGPGRLASGCEISGREGLERTLRSADDAAGGTSLPDARGTVAYGRGVASAMKNNGFGFGVDDAATAEVTLCEGRARVRIGAADVGQGIETVLVQIAAKALGLAEDEVGVEWRDTRASPEAGSSSASRQTVAAGNAVLCACEKVLEQLSESGSPREDQDSAVSARCTWRFPETVGMDDGPGVHLAAFGWSTAVADVAVDTRTGVVRVLRVVNVVDAGRAMNPVLLRGQVEGGTVMGQGYALLERFPCRDGMPEVTGLEACGVPTAVDAVPAIETVIVEDGDGPGPWGARGIGEVTMIAVVPAITAAIHAACGVWINELPATPERIISQLEGRWERPTSGSRNE